MKRLALSGLFLFAISLVATLQQEDNFYAVSSGLPEFHPKITVEQVAGFETEQPFRPSVPVRLQTFETATGSAKLTCFARSPFLPVRCRPIEIPAPQNLDPPPPNW
jgi:hypothetical protein